VATGGVTAVDPLLAALARRTRGFPGALGLLSADGDRVVLHGCTADSDFEIGSITKGVTGLLYADALGRGEVAPDTRLGDLLPLGDGAAAGIRLADLATHRSGLPRLLVTHNVRRSWGYLRRGTNPYAGPVEDLLELARTARLRRPGRPRYSNAGFQLFGLALAGAAGLSYRDLVRTRIADPLGLDPFYVPESGADLAPTALPGHNRGRVVEPWAGAAVAAAGGVRASVAAMVRFARALLDGTAAGVAALDPVAEFAGPAVRIGAGWITVDRRGKGILTWHNGGTGGFRTYLGLLREEGRAVVALGSTTHAVDSLALAALDGNPGGGTVRSRRS